MRRPGALPRVAFLGGPSGGPRVPQPGLSGVWTRPTVPPGVTHSERKPSRHGGTRDSSQVLVLESLGEERLWPRHHASPTKGHCVSHGKSLGTSISCHPEAFMVKTVACGQEGQARTSDSKSSCRRSRETHRTEEPAEDGRDKHGNRQGRAPLAGCRALSRPPSPSLSAPQLGPAQDKRCPAADAPGHPSRDDLSEPQFSRRGRTRKMRQGEWRPPRPAKVTDTGPLLESLCLFSATS